MFCIEMGSSVNRIFIQMKKVIRILCICTGCLVLAACDGQDAGPESVALQETGKIQNTEMQQKSEDTGGRIENTEAERGTETQEKSAEQNAKKATRQTEEKSGQDHAKDDGNGRGIYRKCSGCIKLTAGVIDQKKKVL